jgi:hypothetical protein
VNAEVLELQRSVRASLSLRRLRIKLYTALELLYGPKA